MLNNLDYDDEQKLLNAIVQIGSFCEFMERNHFDLVRETNGDIRSVGQALEEMGDRISSAVEYAGSVVAENANAE